VVDPEPIVLEVPARAEYVRLARMLVASVAAGGRDLDDEWVDDLRLAVSEACALAVDGSRDGRLSVTCREEAEGLVVEVRDATLDPEGDGLAFELIRALVDDVAADVDILRLRMNWVS
jgi:anti-sigma regulatory factor (Ser/Thr protein kinase)